MNFIKPKSLKKGDTKMKKTHKKVRPSKLNKQERARLDQAQQYVYDALECTDKKEIEQLACKAIECSSYCADAILLLSDCRDVTAEERLFSAFLAMNSGKMALGDEFELLIGHFWGAMQTRPFMRAVVAHADALKELTGYEAVLVDYQYMLILNPNDNQGVRYEALPLFIELNLIDQACKLFCAYPDDNCIVWVCMEILLDYLKDPKKAKRTFIRYTKKENFKAFISMIDLLIGKKKYKPLKKDTYSAWSEEEAIAYYPIVADAWESVDGAVDWLTLQMQ